MASLCVVARLRLPSLHHHTIPTPRRSQNQQRILDPLLLLPAFDSPQQFIFSRSTSKFVMGLRRRRRSEFASVWASPSNSGSDKPSSSAEKEDRGGQGPPFLTILAGFLVFLGFCWVLVTIGTWLFNLIVFPPPPKQA